MSTPITPIKHWHCQRCWGVTTCGVPVCGLCIPHLPGWPSAALARAFRSAMGLVQESAT